MAEDKKGFLLYANLIHTVRKLPADKAGILFMSILAYVNDENPQIDDLLVEIAFEPIKQQLKIDLKKWEDFKQKQSLNGKKGGRPRVTESLSTNPNNPSLISESQKSLNVNDNDTVNVNDNESNTLSKNFLQESNLFRQPKIPKKEEVQRIFVQQGGTAEMADAFFEKNSSTGWFLKGSPIVNFSTLVPSFINNWKKISDATKSITKPSSSEARIEAVSKF